MFTEKRSHMKENRPPFRIGVKYCGNCNERYDKKAAYRWIVSNVPDYFTFEAAALKPTETFDYLLVFCGCQAQCADISKLKYRYGICSIYQDTVWQDVVDRMLEADQQKESR